MVFSSEQLNDIDFDDDNDDDDQMVMIASVGDGEVSYKKVQPLSLA